jgi:hypothetical protein
MRCISLSVGGWLERLPVKISQEERAILSDPREESWCERKRLVADIQSRSLRKASKEDGEKAQNAYEQNRIKESETIAANVIIPSMHGSIICKIDGQYKFIRF